ncbi:MAG TPA: hypothetical protein VF282_02340 [Bacillota bacterium]
MSAVITDDMHLALRLLNERLPLLVEAAGDAVRERVAYARAGTDPRGRSLEIVTYRGRRLVFQGITAAAVEVTERDAQGVPVAYALLLDGDGGAQRLTFVA